jgi:hypothetical protein
VVTAASLPLSVSVSVPPAAAAVAAPVLSFVQLDRSVKLSENAAPASSIPPKSIWAPPASAVAATWRTDAPKRSMPLNFSAASEVSWFFSWENSAS